MKQSIRKMSVEEKGLEVFGEKGEILASFSFSFSIGATAYQVVKLIETETGYLGITENPEVTVEIIRTDHGASVEVVGTFAGTEDVHYFKSSRIHAPYGRAFVPDADCRLFETCNKELFYLTNSGMILQKQVEKQDLWLIAPPPHLISFGEENLGWCGLSLPEPLPVVSTQFSCQENRFGLQFTAYSPAHASGRMPRVFIEAGLENSKDILDRHVGNAKSLGLISDQKPAYDWWHNPVYCTWGDQCYLQRKFPAELEDELTVPFNEEKMLRWAEGIRQIYDGDVNYIVDAGWFTALGDYTPNSAEFSSVQAFKSVMDRLKKQKFRVILWYTPFWVQPQATISTSHPEWMIRRLNGEIYKDDADRSFLDFSNPDVRNYAEAQMRFMLTTLDADGFKIDMNYVMPLMSDVVMHDPTWGYGNQLWLEVLKFFHETATAIKEDVFFTISGIESYLQPYASSVRLNDLFDFDNARPWYDRAEMVSRLMPNVPIDVDGWPASLEKMREYQFVSPVFGAPVTYYIEAVDIKMMKLSDRELNRMASVWQVYGKVPCSHGMTLTIDADRDLFERRDAEGRLRAVALQKSALVCFSDDAIYVTANCDRAVGIPVVNPAVYEKAEKVYRDGRRETVNFFTDGQTLLLNVEDSGSGFLYYEIV